MIEQSGRKQRNTVCHVPWCTALPPLSSTLYLKNDEIHRALVFSGFWMSLGLYFFQVLLIFVAQPFGI